MKIVQFQRLAPRDISKSLTEVRTSFGLLLMPVGVVRGAFTFLKLGLPDCFGQKMFRERKEYKENIGVVAVYIKGASTEGRRFYDFI